MVWKGRRKQRERGQRILFATDVHGSDTCFRKFINSAQLYDINYLILGGDITGKMLVPIVRTADGAYDCNYGADKFTGLDDSGVAELIKRIRGFGHYTVTVSPEELGHLQADEAHRDAVFRQVVLKSCEDWVALAEERLRGTGIRCFMAPGNDDFLSIDEALSGSDVVEFAENTVIDLDDSHQMITTGYSNPTRGTQSASSLSPSCWSASMRWLRRCACRRTWSRCCTHPHRVRTRRCAGAGRATGDVGIRQRGGHDLRGVDRCA